MSSDKIAAQFYKMNENLIQGILTQEKGKAFLLGPNGEHYLETELIWDGYIRHWLGKPLYARYLAQRDYERGKPIVIMWPDDQVLNLPYIELYYNERLVKYLGSILGHIAINLKGEVFNFAFRVNENEVVKREEYLYRPALGEFAPHPVLGCFHVGDREKAYYNNFGRLFMRTIHVLRIEGPDLDTVCLSKIFHTELQRIHNTPVDPKKPGMYRDFDIFTQSCTTIIRDGLRRLGFQKLSGISPKDFFVNASHFFYHMKKEAAFKVRLYRMKQLKVPEAPYSAETPILNPINRIKQWRLPRY